ncbi:hypothetical protein MMC12_000795 [Toensbergia leucococca]|nr:hypothetical protein [Toensbergia leucococca]
MSIETGVRRVGYSSSPPSSPPNDPESPAKPSSATTARANTLSHSQNHNIGANVGGEKSSAAGILAKPNHVVVPASITLAPKKPRKKKDANNLNSTSTTTASSTTKEAKPRKPRAPPDKSKKKSKADPSTESKIAPAISSRQPKISFDLLPPSSALSSTHVLATGAALHQNGNNEVIANKSIAFCDNFPPGQQIPRSSSGQNYDPIRSSTTTEPRASPHQPFSTRPLSPTPVRSPNCASASPSIASLIEPPNVPPKQTYPFLQPSKLANDPPLQPLASPIKARLSPPANKHVQQSPRPLSSDRLPPNDEAGATSHATTTMDIDVDQSCGPLSRPSTIAKKSSTSTSTGPSSLANSPKPIRQKETPLPLASGNGILSSAIFGGTYDSTGPEKIAPTVILHVPLNGGNNMYINFARMAEEQYGFNALHPRLAAQRERLARVAAAGAALENAQKMGRNSGSGMSTDEMSVDLSEGETSNVEMGGMGVSGIDMMGDGNGGEGSESTLKKMVPKKRKMKEDQYDKEDPFVDDTELAWEEQAAASKDGFFVYSGPLIPEGEKANVERAESTAKRGRGKGRAGATRGTGTGRGGAAGGGTPGTRGGGASGARKPRVTKASKLVMDQEKVEREKMAVLAAKPTSYPG